MHMLQILFSAPEISDFLNFFLFSIAYFIDCLLANDVLLLLVNHLSSAKPWSTFQSHLSAELCIRINIVTNVGEATIRKVTPSMRR